jgi:type II secretory pathway component GspD/PulD (secretin)
VIANREFKGTINLNYGEPAVVAGSISTTDQNSMNGIPGLGSVPGFNKAMTTNSKEKDYDELLVVISPYLVASTQQASDGEIWLTK